MGFAPKGPAESTHCGSCGFAVAPGNSYCPECGALLNSEQSPIAVATRRSLPPSQTVVAATPKSAEGANLDLVCERCDERNVARALHCQRCGSALALPDGNTRRPREFDGGPPGSSLEPCLVVIAQDGSSGRHYPVPSWQADIGRSEGEITLPDDRFVCPRHARLVRDGARVTIQDLASVNGIYKRLINPVRLENGDVFLMGMALLKIELLAPNEQNLSGAIDRGTQVFGTPPGPRYARLSEQTMEGIPRSIFVVTREETILGREVGDIVFSSDPFMSRRHAAITRNNSDGSFSLLDLGSSNGTFIRIRGQVELVPGDHVRIGQHLFRYDSNNGQVPGQEQAQAR